MEVRIKEMAKWVESVKGERGTKIQTKMGPRGTRRFRTRLFYRRHEVAPNTVGVQREINSVGPKSVVIGGGNGGAPDSCLRESANPNRVNLGGKKKGGRSGTSLHFVGRWVTTKAVRSGQEFHGGGPGGGFWRWIGT